MCSALKMHLYRGTFSIMHKVKIFFSVVFGISFGQANAWDNGWPSKWKPSENLKKWFPAWIIGKDHTGVPSEHNFLTFSKRSRLTVTLQFFAYQFTGIHPGTGRRWPRRGHREKKRNFIIILTPLAKKSLRAAEETLGLCSSWT